MHDLPYHPYLTLPLGERSVVTLLGRPGPVAAACCLLPAADGSSARLELNLHRRFARCICNNRSLHARTAERYTTVAESRSKRGASMCCDVRMPSPDQGLGKGSEGGAQPEPSHSQHGTGQVGLLLLLLQLALRPRAPRAPRAI